MRILCLLACLTMVSACALNRPDHFFVLDSSTSATLGPRNTFATQLTLRVTLPVLVDRSELVLANSNGVQILEHERWASPLTDQVTTVLGRDIESRREDVILASRRIAQPGVRDAMVSIDIVQLSLQRASGVRLEARWRLDDGPDGKITQGRETFSAPTTDGTYLSLVRAVDNTLGLLADRLVADLPR